MTDSARITRITSLNNPRVKAAARLREQGGAGGRRETGRFLAEGRREVTRAAAAGLRIVELYVCPELLGEDMQALFSGVSGPSLAPPMDSLRSGLGAADHFEVSPAVLKKMAYRRDPEGVLAVVERPRWGLDDLTRLCEYPATHGAPSAPAGKPPVAPTVSGTGKPPVAPTVSGAGKPPAAPAPETGAAAQRALNDDAPLLLVAVGTAKPGNLGAMVRTADAAGCVAVLSAGTPVDAFNPNAIRASTGAVFTMPVVSVSEADAIAWLAGSGVKVVAAVLGATQSHVEADLTGPLAIVIGPEDTGLGDAWLGGAGDGRDAHPAITPIIIPMYGRTADSLNASNATAVLLFEALRQRMGV